MPKKIADKRSSEAFILAHVSHQGKDCLLWPFRLRTSGYGLAVLDGKQMHAHRWMAILAHGAPSPDRPHAAHNCGNRACVNPLHLRWATDKENASDRKIHGTMIYGDKSGKTSLTEADVREIRASDKPLNELAETFGVSRGCISKIRSRQRWPHVQ